MRRLALLLLAIPAAAAFAHPGDHAAAGVLHFLAEPDHLAALAAPLVIGAAWWLRRRLRRRWRGASRR